MYGIFGGSGSSLGICEKPGRECVGDLEAFEFPAFGFLRFLGI